MTDAVFSPSCGSRVQRAFSLVEVVVATGIVAIAIAAVMGLLPVLTRQAAESAEVLVAQQLAEPLRVELDRVARERGLDALAGWVPILSSAGQPGFACVATRDGGRVRIASESTTVDEQFHLIEMWRFAAPPLAYEPGRPVLPLQVRVSWPYRTRGGTAPTASGDRKQLLFVVAISR